MARYLQFDREEIAHQLNSTLIGHGIDVHTSERRGPYTVTVKYLNQREMKRLVKLLVTTLDRGRTDDVK